MPLFPSHFELGLLGYPLGHSLSPRIQTAALHACGLEGNYSLCPIPPDDQPGLQDLLARVRSGEIQGLNVTIPHKQTVMPLLDELTPTAASIGAVNTIYLRENKLIGDNTDAPGFLKDLHHFLAKNQSQIAKSPNRQISKSPNRQISKSPNRQITKSALVLGAGGSARAVVYALLSDGWKAVIAARRIEQAGTLAKHFGSANAIEHNIRMLKSADVQLIVNTTPVGMTPNIDQSPWPAELPFPSEAVIYDLIYNPRETKLVREACAQGRPATTGLGMLIEQAALAFEIWTRHQPSRQAMFDALDQTAH